MQNTFCDKLKKNGINGLNAPKWLIVINDVIKAVINGSKWSQRKM